MRVRTPAERQRRVRLILALRRRREVPPDTETTIAELRERFGTDKENDR